MKWVGVVLSLVVGIALFQLFNVKLPEEAVDTFPTRIFIGIVRLFTLKQDLYEYLYGIESKYQVLIQDAEFPYSAKPERVEDGLKIRDTVFGGVKVRTYEPLGREKNGPGVMFFHGGGFATTSVEFYDGLTREWAIYLNTTVVSVEYRKLPYPVPFQDCLNAFVYFLEHASDYDVDPKRLAVAGDSAGGNLATAVSMKLRDLEMSIKPKLQILIYPMIQALDYSLPSYIINQHDIMLTKERIVAMWLLYAQGSLKNLNHALHNQHVTKDVKTRMASILNHDIITGKKGSTPQPTEGVVEIWNELKDVLLDPYFAPLLAENLGNLPQALVYTVEQDVLKDEGILYARRLKESGNTVEHCHNKAGFHGICSYDNNILRSQDAKDAKEHILKFIKQNL